MERTKDSIKQWLKTVNPDNPAHVAALGRALLFLYSRQTSDEQQSQYTKHNNGMGFSAYDAEFMSSVAVKYQKYGRLTPKQASAIARAMVRYAGQLLEMPIPQPEDKQAQIAQALQVSQGLRGRML